jgi:hypothetical protein
MVNIYVLLEHQYLSVIVRRVPCIVFRFCLHYVLTGLIFCGFEIVKNIQINLFSLAGKGAKMKQKYTIIKDDKNKQLIIREFAELDKEILSLLCEETYEQKVILAAIKSGKDDLISALRTNNLYPPGIYANKIADSVKELYATKGKESEELFFDDLELLARANQPEPRKAKEPVENQDEELDDLLEDDFESDYEDEDPPKKMDSSLKIADDEFGDSDDES